MSKEFIKYSDEDIFFSYALGCNVLIEYAKEYVKEDRNVISDIDKKVRDAVIIDSINYFGLMNGYDLVLTTNDLYSVKKYSIRVDANYLLNKVEKVYANYIFEEGIVDSVLLNCHTNSLNEKFNENDGIIVLIDFMNYISKINGFDKIFTLKELYEKTEEQKHIKEMKELKNF